MATRRVIKGVLGNFLGTYVSRYSDYEGYWLFGFLIDYPGALRIDLLMPIVGDPNTPLGVAIRSAADKFRDQCRKANLTPALLREAWLTISQLPGSVRGSVNGRPCDGYSLRLATGAVTDNGRKYEREQVVFVARHNAAVELRSTRADERRAAPDRGCGGTSDGTLGR